MTNIDELLKEFAEQEYPIYGSRMDDHRQEMQDALIVRLRTLIDNLMPDEKEKNKMAKAYLTTLKISHCFEYEKENWFKADFIAGVDAMCKRMKQ